MNAKFNIDQFEPCYEARKFYKTQNSFEEAWQNCERGDWMLWISYKLGVDLRPLTLAKAKCAETVLHLMKDERSVFAVKQAIKFGNGEIDLQELEDAAAYAAYAADAAAYAADAAAYAAAYAADAAAYAAYAAAYAAYAAAYAADAYAADADAEKENQLKTANICREILTKYIFEIINK